MQNVYRELRNKLFIIEFMRNNTSDHICYGVSRALFTEIDNVVFDEIRRHLEVVVWFAINPQEYNV